jgi:hypothetical protein
MMPRMAARLSAALLHTLSERIIMNFFSKTTLARLSMLTFVIASAAFPAAPASAAGSNPAYDVTGNWKAGDGQAETLYQEKKRITVIAVNAGWAHIGHGFYVSANKAHIVILRRNRDSSGCETILVSDYTVNSANSISEHAVAQETACGIPAGYVLNQTLTRIAP